MGYERSGGVMSGVRQAGFQLADRLLRTVDSQRLARHLMEHHVENEIRSIADEIETRQDDFPLLVHNVVRHVNISAENGRGMACEGIEDTEPHILQVEKLLASRGVPDPTAAEAIYVARKILPAFVTWDARFRD